MRRRTWPRPPRRCRSRSRSAPRLRATQTTLRLAPPEPLGFARATTPREFRLPEDHGPHFEYQTEWWYYTGQLVTPDRRRFGFQLTFFRRGLSPGPPPASGLATNQVYFAHFAVTDVEGGRHLSAERVSRGAAGLAGASGEPFRVAVEDWSAARNECRRRHPSGCRRGTRASCSSSSSGRPSRSCSTATAGCRRRAPSPATRPTTSGYTRMAARGRIGADASGAEAAGEAWFDHEWSTSALGPGAVGWDWWSLQLDDGRELMFFELRRQDGGR